MDGWMDGWMDGLIETYIGLISRGVFTFFRDNYHFSSPCVFLSDLP